MTDRKCVYCDMPLRGRSDKKFCNYHCRNTFNNERRRAEEAFIRKIVRVLRHNRMLLQAACPNQYAIIHKQQLDMSNFDFRYYTSSFKSASGLRFFQVFDYAYHPFLHHTSPCLFILRRNYRFKQPTLW